MFSQHDFSDESIEEIEKQIAELKIHKQAIIKKLKDGFTLKIGDTPLATTTLFRAPPVPGHKRPRPTHIDKELENPRPSKKQKTSA